MTQSRVPRRRSRFRSRLKCLSPKTARAVSAEAGRPYHDKLLALPPFLLGAGGAETPAEVTDGLRLTGYFLENHALDGRAGRLAARDRLIERFANDSLHHRLQQIAMDGSQKLPQRWLAGARKQLDTGGEIGCTALGVAAWIRYTAGNDLAGARHPVDDPMADTFATLHADHRGSEALIAAFLGLDSVFPRDLADDARFSHAVREAYRTLDEGGVERSLIGLDARTR